MTVNQMEYGKATLKWQVAKSGGFEGAVILDGKRAAFFEDSEEKRLLSRLQNEAGRLHPAYIGFEGAMKRYLHFFPSGLIGAANAANERDYKERAAARLRTAMPLEQASKATNSDVAQLAKAGIQTNMLSPFESARLQDTLLGKTGGDFVRGAAAFASGNYASGAAAMAAAVKPHGPTSWPIVTYLPFLWDYTRHMLLKPTVTIDFADHVGHDFHHRYVAEPNADTYMACPSSEHLAQSRARISGGLASSGFLS